MLVVSCKINRGELTTRRINFRERLTHYKPRAERPRANGGGRRLPDGPRPNSKTKPTAKNGGAGFRSGRRPNVPPFALRPLPLLLVLLTLP